jgi:hypothetical protein
MKKVLLSILFILSIVVSDAQTTAIPDANFEQALINLGFDAGVPNGVVLTANINTATWLTLSGNSISDLTGIEDFTALIVLECDGNLLSNLNVSQNLNLWQLNCLNNQISNLDVTQNTSLVQLFCSENLLTSLDVSQNPVLENLDCRNNQLSTLDVSGNPNLEILHCRDNSLFCLNMKNGNNSNFTGFEAFGNSNLTCIDVDDAAYSTTNWNFIDAQTSFSTNCSNRCSITTDIQENSLSNISLYPNPTTGIISIDLGVFKNDVKATLTNGLGQVILSDNYTSTNYIKLDIDAPKGIYFLQIESNGEVITRKTIKE